MTTDPMTPAEGGNGTRPADAPAPDTHPDTHPAPTRTGNATDGRNGWTARRIA